MLSRGWPHHKVRLSGHRTPQVIRPRLVTVILSLTYHVCIPTCLRVASLDRQRLNRKPMKSLPVGVSNFGQMFVKSQVTDYRCRGTELHYYNLINSLRTHTRWTLRKATVKELVGEDIQKKPCKQGNIIIFIKDADGRSGAGPPVEIDARKRQTLSQARERQ